MKEMFLPEYSHSPPTAAAHRELNGCPLVTRLAGSSSGPVARPLPSKAVPASQLSPRYQTTADSLHRW